MPANAIMTLFILLRGWKQLPFNAKIGVPLIVLLLTVGLPVILAHSPDADWLILPWLLVLILSCATIPDYNHPAYK